MNLKKKKIEFAAEVTSGFRGLPVIIFGVSFCLFALLNYSTELDTQTRNGYGKDLTYPLIFCLLFGVYQIFGYPRIRDYYRRKYGRTNEKSASFQTFLRGTAVMLPFILSYFFAGKIDAQYRLPFSVTVLLSAMFILLVWSVNYRGISNIALYLAGILLLTAFLPWEQIFLAVTNSRDYDAKRAFYENLLLLIYGLSGIAGGLTEYLFMIKMLKPIEREEEIYESV